MKLIRENVEEAKVLTEGTGHDKKYFIEGIFLQAELKNRNGRVYPKRVMHEEVMRYIKSNIDTKTAWGELDHPDSGSIKMQNVSHRIVSLKEDGNNYIGKAQICNTPMGNVVKGLLEDGGQIGVSSRGMGSLKESNGVNIVQNDFRLITAADIVADPSAPSAYVNGIMEGKEWVWENGILCEKVITDHKKIITNASSIVLEQKMIGVFKDFLKKLSENQ